MKKITETFKAISGAISYSNLPVERKQITFYSEGKNYWPHLQGLLEETLAQTDLSISYVSSSLNDPGLAIEDPRVTTHFIGMGFIRDYFFQSLNTPIMVMTMPDLHQYQVKRSNHNVHYVYVQHSLVSLHMVYRHGAFDHYDTICCAGPHHVTEVRAIEQKYQLPKKNTLDLGYSRLDSLIAHGKQYNRNKTDTKSKTKTILIAPSWGAEGLIESGLGKTLVDALLMLQNRVVLRPHPQTTKFAYNKVMEIVDAHQVNPLFSFEDNVAGQDSLHASDIMVSDWSGAALEYAFALSKPVIFCDVPKKVNNPEYGEIDITPIEVSIRNQIGVIWDGKDSIKNCIAACEGKSIGDFEQLRDRFVFNPTSSDQYFGKMLVKGVFSNG